MSTSRAQKKKAAKRAKRREKRRRGTVAELRLTASALLSPMVGMRKLSETLLVYAEPLLQAVVDPSQDDEVEGALTLASTLWNIVVLLDGDKISSTEMAARRQQILDELASTPDERSELEAAVALLIDRKRTLFPEDRRIIADVQMHRRGNRISVSTTGTLEL